ncbi:CDP-alcohol phosphatidyltransferase family protein [Massilia sp. S19_KUP03_FR1]|uniref:CDP-alcohol phosphatidyltransferase family protein n=1 Tax=Massilia sp. S19_KUP03_FR1 TaxID=3025503 RepID=UPI002FCDA79E
MTLYQIKPQFQAWLRPLVRRLASCGVRANQVTVLAAIASLVVGALVAALAQRPALFLILPPWLFMRMALNAIDGMLAREHGQQSTLGAYLNELGDIVSDLALIAPFVQTSAFGGADVFVFALSAVLVECAGLIGPLARASRRYDGPLGKSDRAFILGALSLWIGLGMGLGPLGHIVWIGLSTLSILTIFKRVRGGIIESRQISTQSSEPIL